MKFYPLFLLIVGSWAINTGLQAQTVANWQKLESVEDVCRAYPGRMDTLLQTINLDLPGLSAVKSAYQSGQISQACTHLLAYYQTGETANFLRRDLPKASVQRAPEADPILENTYTFYNQTAQVPVRTDGHLDWAFQGPSEDIEWAWALNRHAHLGTLLSGYFASGNPEYAKALDHHLKDWVIASLPYPRKKSSTAMWRGLEVALRIKHWANTFYSLIQSDDLSPATRLLMLSSLPEHAHYLRSFHAQGNWLTMEMSGLALIASCWPEFRESPAWLQYCKGTMVESMKEQVYPDGVQSELTSHYHYVALYNFDQFLETCEQAGVSLPEYYSGQIEKMWNYLAYAMRPDGNNPLNNDSDLGNYKERVMTASDRFKRPDWRFIATNGKEGTAPEAPSILFPYAGQAIFRNGWDARAQWSFFDVGPWGSGHQHNDKLHLSVSAYGRDLLVDGGRFAYRGEVADKFRSYAIGSASHNVLLIDGKGQAPGPRTTETPLDDHYFKHSDQLDYAWNRVDHFRDVEGSVEHQRAVAYVPGEFWIVLDQVRTDRPRQIEALWHWHPDCKVMVDKNDRIATMNEHGNLQVIPLGRQPWEVRTIKGQETPEPQGWYSREYNIAEPNTTQIYQTRIDKDAYFVWLLYPSLNSGERVKARITGQQADGIEVQVKTPKGKRKVFVPFGDSAQAKIDP